MLLSSDEPVAILLSTSRYVCVSPGHYLLSQVGPASVLMRKNSRKLLPKPARHKLNRRSRKECFYGNKGEKTELVRPRHGANFMLVDSSMIRQ